MVIQWGWRDVERKGLQDSSFFKQTLKLDPSFLPVSLPLCHADQTPERPKPGGIWIHCEGCYAAVHTTEMVSEPDDVTSWKS